MADCLCATPEYPHFDMHCPVHGRLTPSTGSYDQRQMAPPLTQCDKCGRWYYMHGTTCQECQHR